MQYKYKLFVTESHCGITLYDMCPISIYYIYIYIYIYIKAKSSLTSHVCNILESIVKDSIINYINVNNLLNETQHGFISKRSCLTNLLQFIDQGYPEDIVFLDFQKALTSYRMKDYC